MNRNEKTEEMFNIKINNFQSNNIDRRQLIKEQLRTKHFNDEECELISNLCLEFSDIFYLEGDHLTFTNEINIQ